jgi:hypothetical protein
MNNYEISAYLKKKYMIFLFDIYFHFWMFEYIELNF